MSTAEIRAPSDQPPGVQGRRRKSPLAAATRPPSRCFRPEQGPARCRLLRLSALPGLDRRCSNQRLSHSHQRPREWICLTGVRGRKPGRSGRIPALQDPRFRLSDLGRTFSRPAHQLDAALAIPHAKSLDSEKPEGGSSARSTACPQSRPETAFPHGRVRLLILSCVAPVNKPLTCPNNSHSKIISTAAEALQSTNRLDEERRSRHRTNSFPVPVSPVTSAAQ